MSKQARIKTRELREAQRVAAVKHQRNRRLVTALGVVLILGLLAAIAVVVVRASGGGDEAPPAASGAVVPPSNIEPSGGFLVGAADAPVHLAVYYDYMCPACGAFEKANGAELDRLVDAGTVRVELRPISFLDEQSQGTQYSTRAASAFAAVVDAHPDAAWAFHGALYENQPSEGSKGLTDEQIADIAREAGVPADVVDAFADRAFEPWVVSVTNRAFDDGLQGTPTILIDGQPFQGDPYSTGPLTDAIETAASRQ